MKQYLSLGCSLLFILCASCNSGGTTNVASDSDTVKKAAPAPQTMIMVIDSIHNFGTVKEGEKVVYSYRFKNTGDKPLIISSANASCGCTVPEKPEQPIAPGDSGFIKVVFNSKGTGGVIHKQVRVISNARPDFPLLTLEGEVATK